MPTPTPQLTTRLISLGEGDSLASAAGTLARTVEDLARHPEDSPTVVRCELRIPDVDPMEWLTAQHDDQRFYWEDRNGELRLAGTGLAWDEDGGDLAAVTALASAEEANGLHVLFAGRFDPTEKPAREWTRFGRLRGYLPAIELSQRDGTTRLACHVWLSGHESRPSASVLTRALRAMRRPVGAVEPMSTARDGSRVPMASEWSNAVAHVLGRIRESELEKAVLARRAVHRVEAGLDPVRLLHALSRDDPRTFRFCLQLDRNLAFVGASPELLYRRRDRTVESDALAGTRPRGATEAEDRRLADELVTSAKDQREHRLVREHIRERLGSLCRQLVAPPTPGLRQLTHVQHLWSSFRGGLVPGVDDASILEQLHPTPAVCGLPTELARVEIAACEGFDRGLYGGPIGCVGPNGMQCAVAIRSGLLRGGELFVYAGAGIVAGSSAAMEWDETVVKMKLFSDLLGAEE